METKELNKMLRDRARELGLCDKWYKEWDKKSTRQELIEKYIKGIDFCIKHDYPNLDFAREYFPKNQLVQNGIFLDGKVEGCNIKTAVLLGNSNGNLKYEGQKAGDVYVRHQSDVVITAEGGARVFVEVYDDSKVIAKTDETSKIFVYYHGGEVQSDGFVLVRDKRKAGN